MVKTVKPAFQHFWSDLSVQAKVLFALTSIVIILVFLLITVSYLSEAQNRYFYQKITLENELKIKTICKNEPRLCAEK